MKRNLLYLLSLLLICIACTDDEEKNIFIPTIYKVQGKVEKGPFISGSKVTAQSLDQEFNPTGQMYSGIITDDEGNFNLGELKLSSPYVLLTTDGYYFNEVEGELSDGQISLQSLVNLKSNATANINILTHLKSQRLLQLVKNDILSYKDADKTVQNELLTAFGLQKYAKKDVCNFSITSGTDEAGALIVVSSTLLKGRSDAEFSEYLAKLGAEFKAEGQFSDKTKQQLWETSVKLNTTKIAQNIIKRYQQLDTEVNIPNLNFYIDWDGNGIAGDEITEEGERKLYLETDSLEIPMEGGEFKVKINCTSPVTLTKPAGGDSDINPDDTSTSTLAVFMQYSMEVTKKIEGEYLVINVKPASGRLMYSSEITVYSVDGGLKTNLKLHQKGDKSKPLDITPGGHAFISSIAVQMCTSAYNFSNLDGYYTRCFEGNRTPYSDIYNHSFQSSDHLVKITWENAYKAIRMIWEAKYLIENQGINETEVITYLNQLSATMYYQVANWWENVVYNNSFTIEHYHDFRQLYSEALFDIFKADLKVCEEHSSEKAFSMDTSEDFLFPSRGYSQALLAKMYLHTGNFANAQELLRKIIESNVYYLSPSREESLSRNAKELIIGWWTEQQQAQYYNVLKDIDYIPLMTYTEVLLSAAECSYRLGNMPKALEYLNQVNSARGLALANETGFLGYLRSTWESELKGFGSYFSFLRREGLAKDMLGLEDYQLILPIPLDDLHTLPNITQNQGWQ